MRYPFVTADVFTERRFGGNPLAVITDARGLSAEQMQTITREFNLSETSFVLPPEQPGHTFRLRIFTPGREMPFAGHPTVGTALVLAAVGLVPLAAGRAEIIFGEGVGPVPVTISAPAGHAPTATLSAARMPEAGPPPPASADLAAALGLEPDDILQGGDAPQAFSAGVPFLFVPLRHRAALARARVAGEAWARALSGYWAPEVFVFTRDSGDPAVAVRGRMFAPGLGIVEDPATGAAATALAGYLAARDSRRAGTLAWAIDQGVEMGRPSRINLEADLADGSIVAVRVGGSAVLVSSGEIEV
jgi:trans-2,3-dihydro-3-hydroxyanthranilate isomerase